MVTEVPRDEPEVDEEPDALAIYEDASIEALRNDKEFINKLMRYGAPWRAVQEQLKKFIPEVLSDRDNLAYRLVPKAMTVIFGEEEVGWKTEKRPARSGSKPTTWIVVLQRESS